MKTKKLKRCNNKKQIISNKQKNNKKNEILTFYHLNAMKHLWHLKMYLIQFGYHKIFNGVAAKFKIILIYPFIIIIPIIYNHNLLLYHL